MAKLPGVHYTYNKVVDKPSRKVFKTEAKTFVALSDTLYKAAPQLGID